MEYCKRCGSIWLKGTCSNSHCGKHLRIWAQDDPHYYDDLKDDKPLIHAKRHNSPNVIAMGLSSQPVNPKVGAYHLYMW
jgi:hypothetical protein